MAEESNNPDHLCECGHTPNSHYDLGACFCGECPEYKEFIDEEED